MVKPDLQLVLQTLYVATTRTLPTLLETPNLSTLHTAIISLNPLITTVWSLSIVPSFLLIISIITRSTSWPRRLRPFIPSVALLYVIHPYISADKRTDGWLDLRLSAMAIMLAQWSTTRFFFDVESGIWKANVVDIRDAYIRSGMASRLLFWLRYNVVSCHYVTFVYAGLTAPFYTAWLSRGVVLFAQIDALAVVGMMLCLWIRHVADLQQDTFVKHAQRVARKDRVDKKSVVRQEGMFAWCRQPAAAAEIGTWWFCQLFTFAASNSLLNWTLLFPVLYTAFIISDTVTLERFLVKKYPNYARYQQRVPLFPFLAFTKRRPTATKSKEN